MLPRVGIVAVRDAPSSDAKILGLKHRGDYAVIEGEEQPGEYRF